MKLESQVCTLEQAKRLKELGVKQESNFYWTRINYDTKDNDWWLLPMCLWTKFISLNRDRIIFPDNAAYWWDKQFESDGVYPAFTCAELGEMLPPHFISNRDDFGNVYCYSTSNTITTDEMPKAITEAEARATMLIYLLENKLLSL